MAALPKMALLLVRMQCHRFAGGPSPAIAQQLGPLHHIQISCSKAHGNNAERPDLFKHSGSVSKA